MAGQLDHRAADTPFYEPKAERAIAFGIFARTYGTHQWRLVTIHNGNSPRSGVELFYSDYFSPPDRPGLVAQVRGVAMKLFGAVPAEIESRLRDYESGKLAPIRVRGWQIDRAEIPAL